MFRAFLKLGVTSFGGPIAHLGYFREELVARRKWVSEGQYAELVALCQFLPGPASSQVGFALGLIRAGFRGAVAAWVAFTLPSALLLVLFAIGAVRLEGIIGQGLIVGLKAVAVAVVAHAVIGMARTLTPDLRRILIGLAAVGLALLLPGSLGQIAAILTGLVAGVLWCRGAAVSRAEALTLRVSRKTGIAALVVFGCLLVGLPVLAALTQNTWVQIADAFTRAGALVFGGGHVVLPLLQAEPAVASSIAPEQFLAGYGAAQAVPGPLFTFAAYLGFDMVPGALAPVAALLALIAVFVPGLLLLVAALPFWDRVRQNPNIRATLAGANAAVVGILAAALWTPVITSAITGIPSLGIAAACFLLLTVWKLPAWIAVLLGAAAGVTVTATGVGLAWA
ncbi:chromate efflux transporter [Leucobacter luti]|uniref:Chromate efflux transporter n=1 Tax=Leucobacter chromiireducens subsp. chromiireducens TaxID=660067 RepID=A0ABS1SSI5_9MICO|nr:chromate efflux transporter [Leucobacter chromiireducens subsp. chromiireducens]MBL3700797.1 chromate efflux transporter [Leucobacter luti]